MMKREQILSILYEMAVVIGGEVRLRPLLTKTLQRLLFHTSFPCGMIFFGTESVRSDGHGAETVEVRLEVSVGDAELADHNGKAVSIPAALLRGGIELREGGALLNGIPCRKDYYRFFLRLTLDEFGVVLLLAPRVPETGLPLTQIFPPVMNNFAKAILLCRSYEAYTEGIITDQRIAKAALKDMSCRNRLILDSVGEGICGLDLEGNATFVNPAAARMLGFETEELDGRRLHAIVHHRHGRVKDMASEDCPIIRTMREGSRNRIAADFFSRRDGSDFQVEYVSTPLMEDGRIVGAVVVFRDITERIRAEEERRRAEKALEESSTLLRNIMESSTDYIFVKDRKLRTILCNEAFARARGKHPADLFGKTDIENGWDPEMVRGNPASGVRGFEQDDLAALDGHAVRSEADLGNVGGEIRIFDTVKLPLRDATGKIIGLVGVSRDVTERKLAEQALQLKTQELERFFNVALDLLCIADTDGYFRRLNPLWESILGYTRGEILEKPILDLVHPDDRQRTIEAMATLASQKEVINFINRYRRKDGSYCWIEWNATPHGKLIYAAARDITGRKETEAELRRLNESLEQIVRERTTELEVKNRELERFNRIFVGRELRMLELKQRIRELETKCGADKDGAAKGGEKDEQKG
jgi:PAS domain S-box-containing protein